MYFFAAKLCLPFCRIQLRHTTGNKSLRSSLYLPKNVFLNLTFPLLNTVSALRLRQKNSSWWLQANRAGGRTGEKWFTLIFRFFLIFVKTFKTIIFRALYTCTSTSQGIDYFENLCLQTESTCADQRTFSPPRVRRMIIMLMMITSTPLGLISGRGFWLLLPKRVIANCHPHNNFDNDEIADREGTPPWP